MKVSQESLGATQELSEPQSGVRAVSHAQVARYDLLDGGAGREINFRPPRYPSAELGPIGTRIHVTLGGKAHPCELRDVSQNGVGFEWRGPAMRVGDAIAQITISFDQHEAYRGEARVGSVRQEGDVQVIGASFIDTLMNVDDVLQLRDVRAWNRAGEGLVLRDRPWHVNGHERIKSLISELRLFFIDAEEQLGELESSLPWNLAHGDNDTPARAALVERIRHEVVDQIVDSYVTIGELVNKVGPQDQQRLKEYSLRHLHEYFMQSPWVRRAKEKPLGYPGDFELMNGLYGNHFTGATLFAKAINMAFVSVPAAAAVRERKNLVRDRLAHLIETRRPANRPIRILSIAAGPAQETFELLERATEIPHPVEIVLFDQDKRALSFAYTRLARLVAAKWSDRVTIVYLHDTIKRLLRDASLFSPLGEFDAVFSCGLFDYLPHPTAATLVNSLYQRLAPGSDLYIGNQTPASTSRWAMEFHCDWNLIYREHPEMLAFAKAGAPDAKIAIVEEATGINPFVMLTRE